MHQSSMMVMDMTVTKSRAIMIMILIYIKRLFTIYHGVICGTKDNTGIGYMNTVYIRIIEHPIYLQRRETLVMLIYKN